MSYSTDNPINRSGLMTREQFLKVLNAAIKGLSYRFARQAAVEWLKEYPGDLEVSYLLAKSLQNEGKTSDAKALLLKVVAHDPEYLDAQKLLANLLKGSGTAQAEAAAGSVYVLGGEQIFDSPLPEWVQVLKTARDACESGSMEEAEQAIHRAVSMNPDFPLAGILHIKISSVIHDEMTVTQLSQLYHDRWPECLHFALYLAENKIRTDDEAGAVNLLRHCVVSDALGQVPSRIWGEDHPYRPLWPDTFEIHFDLPIPAGTVSQLGWNGLPSRSESTEAEAREAEEVEEIRQISSDTEFQSSMEAILEDRTKGAPVIQDENLKQVQEAFETLAKKLKKTGITNSDGRFPIYVIFSSRLGLTKQYGDQTMRVVETEMKSLADVMSQRPRWGSMVFMPDDSANVKDLGLQPIDAIDPWKLKLALKDLDGYLSKKGEMIGALLIVGGPEVVPFHKLPNPTEDQDGEVYSDNPYATLDSNYFVPEWAVGRLPGEAGRDAGLLLEQLRKLNSYHAKFSRKTPVWKRVFIPTMQDNPMKMTWAKLKKIQASQQDWWKQLFKVSVLVDLMSDLVKNKVESTKNGSSFGYTAAVWKRSSSEVYKTIGDDKSLLISPPAISGSFASDKITSTNFAYFNLHGVTDAPEWYGQRDASDSDSGADYPVALTPRELANNGHSPIVVYSEACYGGYIFDKTEDQALSLKFLSIGTPSVVASTGIAYGSVSAPLIGADLLGSLFWKNVSQGLTVGEALMQAKVELVKEMDGRQGLLDGEDQKTLLSFVLYGDPLMRVTNGEAKIKTVMRSHPAARVKMICDMDETEETGEGVSIEVIKEVKQLVAAYLPGLNDARVSVVSQKVMWEEKGTETSGSKVRQTPTGQKVVTITKEIREAHSIHRHYARATISADGKLVKLAISR